MNKQNKQITIDRQLLNYYIAEYLNEEYPDFPKTVKGLNDFFKWVLEEQKPKNVKSK